MDDDAIHPDFHTWVTVQRRRGVVRAAPGPITDRPGAEPQPPPPRSIGAGDVADPVRVDPDSASQLVITAARIAAGFDQPTTRSLVVWVEVDSEIAVEIGAARIALADGRVDITLPVRCDQTGPAEVVVTFAVGAPDRPAGVYASTLRRPAGPKLVVDTWGDALVAFAWQILLGMTAQLAGAVGRDTSGDVLVPAELSASRDGLTVVPMGRFRFSGQSEVITRARS